MAISTKVITMRQGNKADYQPSKMLSGELAVINDSEELHFSARTGQSIRVATERDVEELNNKIASGGGGGNPGGNGGSIVVDSYLSETSTNPVQNKVVAKKFGELSGQISDLENDMENVGKPTDEQISSAVSGWLDEHPEATTTVQDGSITEQKLAPELVDKLMFGDAEPAYDDIPKVFFEEAIPQTKTDTVTKFRYISKTLDFEGYAEFKAQGNSSLGYPKKNMTVKMSKDEALEGKLKVDFKGWGKQRKHVYKANWIDLTHARNVVSARIWADVVKSRADYLSLPELLRTSPNQGAVDGFPVKVYSQGIYQGRYTLNIPKDAWMSNMDDSLDEHCILCGEGYNSGCFREVSMSQWTDEVHDSRPSLITNRWLEVIRFVMNSTDEEFKANLGNYFFVDSLIDYFIYGMVSCGLDAFGKNQLYFTYDGVKWIASMYDMDSTWGLYWNGSKFVSASYSREEFEDYVSQQATGEGNLLYVRLANLFNEEIKSRYEELKHGVLSIPNIINHFERFTDIAPLDLVKEDYASTTGSGKFTSIPSRDTNNIQQLRQFIIDRYAYCDEYFANLTPEVPVPCTGITLDKTTLTFTDSTAQTITATVKPSNTTDKIVWTSSKNDVATVGNGVVTPVANGSCTITATCGNVSATCEVTVNVEEEIVTYTITRNLTNCTSSSAVTLINEGSAHTETITPDSGYTLEGATISVSMGGVDISSSFVDGVLTIASVTGNVVISVSAVEEAEEPTLPENATILAENYSPNGEQFILYDGEFDLNTQKIVACIDMSTCTANNEMLLSIAENETNLAMWGASGNVHILRKNAGDNSYNFGVGISGNASDMLEVRTKVSDPSNVLFELTSEGVMIDGTLFEHTKTEDYLSVAKTYTNIVIGSTQGNTRSMATYKYVAIVKTVDDTPEGVLYPLENGTKTFSNGASVEITNGNHLHILTSTNVGAGNVNVSFISDEDDNYQFLTKSASKQHFSLKNGDVVRTVTKFGESHTADSLHCFFLSSTNNKTLNLFGNTKETVDNTITITEDLDVQTIGYYIAGSSTGYEVDIELEIYVNDVRYV